jgi:hypothetical protein
MEETKRVGFTRRALLTLYVVNPAGKFVRAFDADTPGDRIADALRELMARPSG